MNSPWANVLELRSDRSIAAGSEAALCDAIRRGANLRIYTEFFHHEHIDPRSDRAEKVREVAEFPCTYLLDDRWTAGIMTLRQPIALPDGFGPRPSMSFFLYNQDGRQAIARPHLDGGPAAGRPGPSPVDDHEEMPKYHEQDHWDKGTNAPSSNFIYDFEIYRFYVRNMWREVLAHDADGLPTSGSVAELHDAFCRGSKIKVAIRGLCSDFNTDPGESVEHEVFIETHSCYFYAEQQLFLAASHPVVRAKPAVPLSYISRGWDFGWLMPRTDGLVAQLLYDPYTLTPRRREGRHAIRWFADECASRTDGPARRE